MKLRSISVSVAVFGSRLLPTTYGWVAPSGSSISRASGGHVIASQTLRLFATVPVAGDKNILSNAIEPTGEPIAEGTMVSKFDGGLVCVKINDEFAKESTVSSQVLDPSSGMMSQQDNVVSGDYLGRNIVFADGSVGTVVAHRPPLVFAYSTSSNQEQSEGTVKILDSMSSLSVGALPTVVNAFGQSLAGDAHDCNMERAIFAPIPQVKDIALINNPMLTGVTMIDALAPVGRGQNMLLVGHDHEMMRGFALDFIKTQCRNENTKCIYAAIDNKDETIDRLKELDILDQVHVVVPDGDTSKTVESQAAEAVTVAAAACAIGEAYALQKGMHSVVVVDSIDQFKQLWDATTRTLVDVFGVDAVVQSDKNGGASSEMRAFYSSLVQRAGQFKAKLGGGSVTLMLLTTLPRAHAGEDTVFAKDDFSDSPEKIKARIQLLVSRKIPLTAENLRKIDIPVPSATENERRLALQHVDDLISMSDGQIWLDEKLEKLGQMPPMDPQRSITRVGIGADTQSRADAPAFRRVVERLRLDLSQALNMEGVEVSNAASKQVRRQKALLLAMHQPSGTPSRRLSESCAALLTANEGFLDDTVDKGNTALTKEDQKVIQSMLLYLSETASNVMDEIDSSLDISDENKGKLRDAIASFFS